MCLPIELANDRGELTRVGYDIETAPSGVYVTGMSLATVASLADIPGFESFMIVRVASRRGAITLQSNKVTGSSILLHCYTIERSPIVDSMPIAAIAESRLRYYRTPIASTVQ